MAKKIPTKKNTGKKAAQPKATQRSAKSKPAERQAALSTQAGMATTDIRKDYKKTLLGRFLVTKPGIPGKRF
jgi:hypothetical protein